MRQLQIATHPTKPSGDHDSNMLTDMAYVAALSRSLLPCRPQYSQCIVPSHREYLRHEVKVEQDTHFSQLSLPMNTDEMSDVPMWSPPTYDMTSQPQEAHQLNTGALGDPTVFSRAAKWCLCREIRRMGSHKHVRTVQVPRRVTGTFPV